MPSGGYAPGLPVFISTESRNRGKDWGNAAEAVEFFDMPLVWISLCRQGWNGLGALGCRRPVGGGVAKSILHSLLFDTKAQAEGSGLMQHDSRLNNEKKVVWHNLLE